MIPAKLVRFFALGLVVAMLSACASRLPLGDSAGASTSGAAYLVEIRSSRGLSTLTYDAQLERAALQQSGYMAGARSMKHSTGWGRDFAARMKKSDIAGAAAENIAAGRFDMAKLFDMWMNSAGHRKNMLDPRFSRFGLAYASDGDGTRYWTLVLAK